MKISNKVEEIGPRLIGEGKVKDMDTLLYILDQVGVPQENDVSYELRTRNLIELAKVYSMNGCKESGTPFLQEARKRLL